MIKDTESKKRLQDVIAEFISAKRTVILVFFGLVILFFLSFAVYTEIDKNINEEATVLAENAQQKYDDWLNEDDSNNKSEIETELMEQLDKIITDYSGKYAALRALYTKGLVYYNKEEWQSAYESFILTDDDFKGTYLHSLCIFLAGVCQEELNNPESAIDAYEAVYENYKHMPLITNVVFSIGRLYDEQGNYEKAQEYYNILKADYGSSIWTKYAINRVIYLKSAGKLYF